jgi:type IV pilus assembly protein PilA
MYQQPEYANPGSMPQPAEGMRKGLAIASLVLGIVGFFTAGIFGIGAVIGMTLGFMAMSRANKRPHEYGGKGLAIAGVILNIISLVMIFFVGVIAAIAVPNLLSARRSANTASAQQTLRILHSTQIVYQTSSGQGNFGRLQDLADLEMIDESVARAQETPKSGYVLSEIVVSPQTRNSEAKYSVSIRPATRKGIARTGNDCFFMDETGVILHSGKPDVDATASSPAVGEY